MAELGFEQERAKYWRHAATEYLVEFPPGPLTVGREQVTRFAKRETPSGTLRLVPPTECVMDRLAHYFHFDDPGRLEKYREFEARLADAKRRPKR